MNKLSKIGVSALCGSLAAVSAANAGEIAVSGSANVTWSQNEGEVTGNPIGMTTALSYSGSGELDNGTTFTIAIDHDDKGAYSASQLSMVTPSFGTIRIDQGGGTGIDRFDDMMPTAWEETTGTSVGAGLRTVAGAGGVLDVEYTLPSIVDGMDIHLSYAPRRQGTNPNDKVQGGDTAGIGSAFDVALKTTALADGLTLFAGYSETEQAVGTSYGGDANAKVIGATYAVGSFTLGYQHSIDNTNTSATATNRYYENDAFGVSFAVNDDLSISYGQHKSDTKLNNATSVELKAQSLQLAYTMGGATLKIAETEIDNATYSTATNKDKEGTTLALSLAF